MKKVRDHIDPDAWGWVWIPDDVVALVRLAGYYIDIYACIHGDRKYPDDVDIRLYDEGDMPNIDNPVWIVRDQMSRADAVRALTLWVREGMKV